TPDCTVHHTATVVLPRTDTSPPVRLALFQCQHDSESYTVLCSLALKSLGVTDPMTSCGVEFDAQILIGVSYDSQRTDGTCPEPQFGAGGSTNGSGGGL